MRIGIGLPVIERIRVYDLLLHGATETVHAANAAEPPEILPKYWAKLVVPCTPLPLHGSAPALPRHQHVPRNLQVLDPNR